MYILWYISLQFILSLKTLKFKLSHQNKGLIAEKSTKNVVHMGAFGF